MAKKHRAVVMHYGNTFTPRCKFVFDCVCACIYTDMAFPLFTACFLNYCYILATFPVAESKYCSAVRSYKSKTLNRFAQTFYVTAVNEW